MLRRRGEGLRGDFDVLFNDDLGLGLSLSLSCEFDNIGIADQLVREEALRNPHDHKSASTSVNVIEAQALLAYPASTSAISPAELPSALTGARSSTDSRLPPWSWTVRAVGAFF